MSHDQTLQESKFTGAHTRNAEDQIEPHQLHQSLSTSTLLQFDPKKLSSQDTIDIFVVNLKIEKKSLLVHKNTKKMKTMNSQ